jgi:predicted phage terminase large subunit-like protein
VTLDDLDKIEEYRNSVSRESFYAFRQVVHGQKFKKSWFVKELSHALQEFYSDYVAGLKPILVIEAPPQHGKSEAVSDAIHWLIGRDSSLRFIYASYSDRLGVRANLRVQRTLGSPRYKAIFPKVGIGQSGQNESKNLQRTNSFIEFADGGSFRNTTIQGSITGETLDIGLIDDPLKGREAANSQKIRDKVWDWFTDDFLTRFDENAGLIFVLTRWHTDDPVGRLKKIYSNVKVLSYKAIAEEDEEHRLEGEALFPEHKSLEFLLKRKAIFSKANWSSLYQQNPILSGGNLFKDSYWRYYTVLPKLRRVVLYGDTALKAGEENDYSVFQAWGESCTGQIYLIDQARGKWESPELLVNARAFYNKHKASRYTVTAFKVEDKASGTGLIQTLRREGLPIIGIPRDTDKVTRAHDCAPLLESGNVFLPENAPWLQDYKLEFAQFPNGTNDDQVDPTMDAINDMLGGNIVNYDDLV